MKVQVEGVDVRVMIRETLPLRETYREINRKTKRRETERDGNGTLMESCYQYR